MMEQSEKRYGFTLIELLVVVAIIVILIAMLVPALERAMAVAQESRCLTNHKGLGMAMKQYTIDNRGFFPAKRLNSITSVFTWVGKGGTKAPYNQEQADDRYLNPYVMGSRLDETAEMKMASCPTDSGAPRHGAAPLYQTVGTSYSSSHHGYLADLSDDGDLYGSTNASSIHAPSMLVAGGEHGAHQTAWGDTTPIRAWHGDKDRFTVSFVDGHAESVAIYFREKDGAGFTFHEKSRDN